MNQIVSLSVNKQHGFGIWMLLLHQTSVYWLIPVFNIQSYYLPTDFFPLICIQCLYVSIQFLLWPLKITRHGRLLRKKHNIYFQIQHSISLPPLENNKVNWVTQPMPSCDTFASVLNIIQNLSNFFVPFLNTAGLLWIRIKNTSWLGPVAASKLQPQSSSNNTELTLWE